jgi:hypothetical protein
MNTDTPIDAGNEDFFGTETTTSESPATDIGNLLITVVRETAKRWSVQIKSKTGDPLIQDRVDLGTSGGREKIMKQLHITAEEKAAVTQLLMTESQKPWHKATSHGPAGTLPRFANFAMVEGTDKDGNATDLPSPFAITEIATQLTTMAAGWPKRVQEKLFIPSANHRPVYLDKPARLFAWISAWAQVDWDKGSTYVTQECFYEYLRMTSEQFDDIETLPHWPPIPGIFYMHEAIPEVAAGKLDELLNFFRPESPCDRELIKAMILTMFWGGSPGARPAFLITGPDRDPEQGREVGKSTLCQILAEELAGGAIDLEPSGEIPLLKQRLLSTEAGHKRIVTLDNVKTYKFSWADLEGLITASQISGKAMYVGEGHRPNTLVWMITLNGAMLSKDMAQRSIQIKLARPTFEASWKTNVRQFIRENRWGLIADIRDLLVANTALDKARTRWGEWERDVLGKTQDLQASQATILARQAMIDSDEDDRGNVAAFFAEQLTIRGHDPDVEKIEIPNVVIAEWLSLAKRKHHETNTASAVIANLAIPELERTRSKNARGWVWTGPSNQEVVAQKLNDLPDWQPKIKSPPVYDDVAKRWYQPGNGRPSPGQGDRHSHKTITTNGLCGK